MLQADEGLWPVQGLPVCLLYRRYTRIVDHLNLLNPAWSEYFYVSPCNVCEPLWAGLGRNGPGILAQTSQPQSSDNKLCAPQSAPCWEFSMVAVQYSFLLRKVPYWMKWPGSMYVAAMITGVRILKMLRKCSFLISFSAGYTRPSFYERKGDIADPQNLVAGIFKTHQSAFHRYTTIEQWPFNSCNHSNSIYDHKHEWSGISNLYQRENYFVSLLSFFFLFQPW